MPRTLNDALKSLRGKARSAGTEAIATFEALDSHYAGIATELERLRKRLQLSQRELASRSGLDQAEVSRILSGKSQPRVPTAQRLASALGAELRVVTVKSPSRSPVAKRSPELKSK